MRSTLVTKYYYTPLLGSFQVSDSVYLLLDTYYLLMDIYLFPAAKSVLVIITASATPFPHLPHLETLDILSTTIITFLLSRY